MQIFFTGATGFIGKELTKRCSERGHRISAWVRDVDRARRALGDQAELVALDRDPTESLSRAGAVINLAGEPIIGRWSEAKKRSLVDSRVGITRKLVAAIERVSPRPRVLVSASAVGYYGDGGDATLTEGSPSGRDFLAGLCREWEAAALAAEEHGVRVALIRIGVVLGRGGALSKMLPAFKAGAGGRIGSGEQFMSWIHVADLAEMFLTAVEDERYRGAFNGTGPAPVTNQELTRALGRVLHRPAVVPVPSFALKLMFGEAAAVLTTGQRALPQRAQELGFVHRFRELEPALRDVLA